MKAIVTYLKDVRLELDKVVWPKRDEVIKLTLIVFLISAFVGLYVGALDYIFTKTLSAFINH